MRLTEIPLFIIDCQTTGTRPGTGSVIEMAWTRTSSVGPVLSSLIALPEGAKLSKTVQRITGLTERALAGAPDAQTVWQHFLRDLAGETSPLPCVIHYARFEHPFLTDLNTRFGGERPFPLDIVCSFQIVRKLLPGLPSSTLRAVSGHFGRVLGERHRAEDHVLATLSIWRQLALRLENEIGIGSWEELKVWLTDKRKKTVPRKTARYFLLPREKRLRLPTAPGVYRMLAQDGTLLYIGKATSLKERVNSYFRSHTRSRARVPEMLAQVRDIDVTPVETSLEAALLEADEIKRWNPPYNASLRTRDQSIRFWSRDFSDWSSAPDPGHPHGPFSSTYALEQLAPLAEALRTGTDRLGVLTRWRADGEISPDEIELVVAQGTESFAVKHGLRNRDTVTVAQLLNLGSWLALVREQPPPEETEEKPWGPQDIVAVLESSLRQAARITHRTRWVCRLSETSLSWRLADGKRRVLSLTAGQVVYRATLPEGSETPPPAQWSKTHQERQSQIDLVTLDRLAVLYAELRRLVSQGHAVEIRVAPGRRLGESDLRRWWNLEEALT